MRTILALALVVLCIVLIAPFAARAGRALGRALWPAKQNDEPPSS